jgi:hypothetical protein
MTSEHKRTQPQLSDVYANPQDTAFGHAAAEDQERVDRGEEPEHDDTNKPNAWGKADPA